MEKCSVFADELGEKLIDQIGEPQFERLQLLVAETVAAALNHAAERIDDLPRALRVVLLPDGETVHNASFDRGFKP